MSAITSSAISVPIVSAIASTTFSITLSVTSSAISTSIMGIIPSSIGSGSIMAMAAITFSTSSCSISLGTSAV